MSNGLPVVPLAHAAGDLLQELFVVLQDLWDLVEHLIHQQGVHYRAAVWLFERTHVALRRESPADEQADHINMFDIN